MEECSDMLSMALQQGGYYSTFMDTRGLDLKQDFLDEALPISHIKYN